MEEMHAWVARDYDGRLYMYSAKPKKEESFLACAGSWIHENRL